MKATTSRTLPSIMLSIVFIGLASLQIHQVTSFSTTKSLIGRRSSIVPSSLSTGRRLKSTTLHMAKGKKKRRKRKNAPPQQPSNTIIPEDDMEAIKELSQSESQTNIDELKAIANFQATAGGSSSTTTSSINNIGLDGAVAGGGEGKSLVEVPDIRDALKNKELKRIEEEEAQKLQRPKISRKDTKAFLELLEAEPFADADDSYFEDEEYGTVSALLAEGAKPFLGIPPGPLQVGHFIGSLGIILCAFIDYPGFPLTNLPTPLRDALQGGKFLQPYISLIII